MFFCCRDKAGGVQSRRQRTYSVDNYTTGLTDPESSQSSLQAPSTTSSYAASQGDVTSSCSSPPTPLHHHHHHHHHSGIMHKSVSFQGTTNGVMVNGDGGAGAASGGHSDSDHSLPRTPQEAQWYTRPVHLEKKGFGLLETNPANVSATGGGASSSSATTALSSPDTPPAMMNSSATNGGSGGGGVAEDTSSNSKLRNGNSSSSNGHHRSSGRHHHHHNHHHHHRHRSSSARRSKSGTVTSSFVANAGSVGGAGGGEESATTTTSSTSSIDTLVREFFPVTLGAAYMLNSIPPSSSKTLSPPPKPLPQPNSTPWKVGTKPKSPGGRKQRQNRPGSAHSSSSSASKSSLDKMYFMTAEAPHTGQCLLGDLSLQEMK